MRGFLTRSRALAIIAGLVVAFVAFEVGVRLLPPDAVSYRIEYIGMEGDPTVSGTITNSATVASWRAAMKAHPAEPIANNYLHGMEYSIDCVFFGPTPYATYTFTWHSLPVEVVSPAPATCATPFQVSSGGIPDWNTYLIDPLPQP